MDEFRSTLVGLLIGIGFSMFILITMITPVIQKSAYIKMASGQMDCQLVENMNKTTDWECFKIE